MSICSGMLQKWKKKKDLLNKQLFSELQEPNKRREKDPEYVTSNRKVWWYWHSRNVFPRMDDKEDLSPYWHFSGTEQEVRLQERNWSGFYPQSIDPGAPELSCHFWFFIPYSQCVFYQDVFFSPISCLQQLLLFCSLQMSSGNPRMAWKSKGGEAAYQERAEQEVW